VFKQELRCLFYSWTAYVFLSTVSLFVGVIFSSSLGQMSEASFRPVLSNLALTLLFCVPFITMRSVAGEQSRGTLDGVLATGVPPSALLLGKWLAGLLLCLCALVSTGVHSAVLVRYAQPDLGLLLANYVGLLGCCMVFVAGGLLASALSSEPISAGVGGVLILLPLWLAGVAVGSGTPWLDPFLEAISLGSHLKSFGLGTIDLLDLSWFVGVSVLFLVWSWVAMELRRWA
jgi:ABC-2 type transport system permease protein